MLTTLAVVTGATGGIGGALSEALCRAGFSVYLVGRNLARLQQLRESLATRFPAVQVYAQSCDLCDARDRQALLAAVRDVSHPLSLWVNNAGINEFGVYTDQTEEEIAAQLDVNAKAPMLMTHTLLRGVDASHPLEIVNVGSTFGTIGYPGFVAYSASKFALRGFTEALSRELADTAIKVRYFAPRATQTGLNSEAVNAMNAELKVAMDSPEQVARAFMKFLNSGDHIGYVGFPEKLFARLNQWFPKMVTGAIVKQLPVIRRHGAS